MAYCTIDDVQSLNKNRVYSATSEVTIKDVNKFIDLIAAEIDGRLKRKGYIVPVTGVESLKILKLVNSLGAAFLAEEAHFHGTVEPGISNHAEVLKTEYKERLEAIEVGSLFLRDALTEETLSIRPVGTGLWSLNQEYFGFPEITEFNPIFKIDKEW